MNRFSRQHPCDRWLTLRKAGELAPQVALLVDCHRTICETCDAAARGDGPPLFVQGRTSTGLPRVLAEWIERAKSACWVAGADGIESIELSVEPEPKAWLERRAPDGQDHGWKPQGDIVGLVLAGALSVDGARVGDSEWVSGTRRDTTVRVTSSVPCVILAASTQAVTRAEWHQMFTQWALPQEELVGSL